MKLIIGNKNYSSWSLRPWIAMTVAGIPFDGPMAGHAPGMPMHYDLHVWAWRANPAGTFEEWNPHVHC